MIIDDGESVTMEAANSTTNNNTANNTQSTAASDEGGNRHGTKMILVISMVTLVGHVPNSVSFIMFPFNLLNFYNYNYYLVFCNSLLFISHSNYGLIFYFFNSKFKRTFWELFECKRIRGNFF